MNKMFSVFDAVLMVMSAAIGFFLGLAGLLLAQLIGMGAWPVAVVLIGFGLLVYFTLDYMDPLFDRAFNMGIKKARPGTTKTNPFEKTRKRNGRIAFIVGIFVALVASLFVPPQQLMELL